MKVYALVVVLSSFILLGGCASTEPDTGNYLHPVYTDAFPAARSVNIESPAQILTLPEEAKRFLTKIRVTANLKQSTPLE
ncbi:MAG: hypothetical protein VYD53_05030, partial [Pseudomonadota bacterium]|nr:hypothetical protein [Pseudomonadota bacterium]